MNDKGLMSSAVSSPISPCLPARLWLLLHTHLVTTARFRGQQRFSLTAKRFTHRAFHLRKLNPLVKYEEGPMSLLPAAMRDELSWHPAAAPRELDWTEQTHWIEYFCIWNPSGRDARIRFGLVPHTAPHSSVARKWHLINKQLESQQNTASIAPTLTSLIASLLFLSSAQLFEKYRSVWSQEC